MRLRICCFFKCVGEIFLSNILNTRAQFSCMRFVHPIWRHWHLNARIKLTNSDPGNLWKSDRSALQKSY